MWCARVRRLQRDVLERAGWLHAHEGLGDPPRDHPEPHPLAAARPPLPARYIPSHHSISPHMGATPPQRGSHSHTSLTLVQFYLYVKDNILLPIEAKYWLCDKTKYDETTRNIYTMQTTAKLYGGR